MERSCFFDCFFFSIPVASRFPIRASFSAQLTLASSVVRVLAPLADFV